MKRTWRSTIAAWPLTATLIAGFMGDGRVWAGDSAASAAAAAGDLRIDCDWRKWQRLPSTWPEYFGVHYTSQAGPWKTIRGYGGPHVGFPRDERPLGEGQPARRGPFSGKNVSVSLDDIRNWKRPAAGSLAQWIPELIAADRSAIYVSSGLFDSRDEPFPKDLAYWVMRLAYTPRGAEQHIYWQWGNEINGDHFDMLTPEERAAIPGASPWRFSNLPVKQERYVERYLAPAIEVVRKASQDQFGDPRGIKILSGSCANSYNPKFRQWFYGILDRQIEGAQAPSLRGTPVYSHIDVLTVHYPFSGDAAGNRGGAKVMQEIFDRYVRNKKVPAVWITEEHGDHGRGAVTVVDRGLQYVDWLAANGLSADETRLCWWGADRPKPGGKGMEAIQMLGQFFSGRSLTYASEKRDGTRLHLLSGGERGETDRLLLAMIPASPRRLDNLSLILPKGNDAAAWSVRAVAWSAAKTAEQWKPTVSRDGKTLSVPLDREIAEPLTIFLERTTEKPAEP